MPISCDVSPGLEDDERQVLIACGFRSIPGQYGNTAAIRVLPVTPYLFITNSPIHTKVPPPRGLYSRPGRFISKQLKAGPGPPSSRRISGQMVRNFSEVLWCAHASARVGFPMVQSARQCAPPAASSPPSCTSNHQLASPVPSNHSAGG
jgi:hypothetical protein